MRALFFIVVIIFSMSDFANADSCAHLLSTKSRPYLSARLAGVPEGTNLIWQPLNQLEESIYTLSKRNAAEYGIWYALDADGNIVRSSEPFTSFRYVGIDESEFLHSQRIFMESLTESQVPKIKTIVMTHTHPGWGDRKFSDGDLITFNQIRRGMDGRTLDGQPRRLTSDINFEGYILYKNLFSRSVKKKGVMLHSGELLNLPSEE